MQEARARVPAKVPGKPWAGCVGKIGLEGARKSARECVDYPSI